MNETCLYEKIIDSKTGIKIPVFSSGRTVDSRYDPLRESQKIINQINSNSHFLIVTGIASGTLIKEILNQKENVFVIGIEKSKQDISFLLELDTVKQLSESNRVCLCSLEELEQKIVQLYLPSFYGNLQVIEQAGWINENQEILPFLNQTISKALSIVSADFSVQSHFGKLWQHNILNNISFFKNQNFTISSDEKTAVVFAAGPSLDFTIQNFKDKKKYYLISTDTAFSTLLSNELIPDVVVSLDGQYVSNAHFIHEKKYDFSRTTFLFDLCANSSAVKKFVNENCAICFFKSGHPFSEYINESLNLNIPSLFSGAGTVTISAFDFALKSGFKKIIIAGADFSYINGKPYAKGTYLDRLYNSDSTKINSSQKKYCSLEFRTELETVNNSRFTTKVLDGYRQSFEEYLNNNEAKFKKENDLYYIEISNNSKNLFESNESIQAEINIRTILKDFSNQKQPDFNSIDQLTKKDISLLPLISWIRTHDNNNEAEFNYYFNKAVHYFDKWLDE